ncbi:MAG: trypsin-like serine protease [Bdellovibrionales bacterium]|nr:trypsin-like serine protease [Bdellovibrionales bacterium]
MKGKRGVYSENEARRLLLSELIMVALMIVALFLSEMAQAIVGGVPVPQGSEGKNHPGQFNTVAFVAVTGNHHRTFCTGSIIGEDLILTAKHCMAGKSIQELRVYFGPDTDMLIPTRLREIIRVEVYGTPDWANYFPNMDIAVVQFKGGIPNRDGQDPTLPHYRPLEILRDSDQMKPHQQLTLAGFGNRVASDFEVIAGQLYTIDVEYREYLFSTFFQNLLLLQAKPGQGACHGDSGGPAYFPYGQVPGGETQWLIGGVTNGFDLALTPKALQQTQDPMFPLKAKCDSGQILYGFAGHYVDWIEATFGTQLPRSSWNTRSQKKRHIGYGQKKSFVDWCANTALDEKGWLTARTLVLEASKRKGSDESERDLFLNCGRVEELLSEVTHLEFDENATLDSLLPLTTLPRLHSLELSGRKDLDELGLDDLALAPEIKKLKINSSILRRHEALRGLSGSLESLTISNSGLKNLSFLDGFSKLTELDVRGNSLSELGPALQLRSLQTLHASGNQLEHVSGIEELKNLMILNLATNGIRQMPLLKNLERLVQLDVSANRLDGLEFLQGFKGAYLRELRVSDNRIESGQELLRNLTGLTLLSMNKTGIKDLGLCAGMKDLKRLEASGNGVETLEVFRQASHGFIGLQRMVLTFNLIENYSPLAGLKNLTGLWVNGNPLSNGDPAPSDQNCPLKSANSALDRTCRNLRR